MLGVKTIGNATLIAFDGPPVLATDPWLGDEDEAYFGSWALSHEIPAAERREILGAPYVWFSHGHPDHLNPLSVQRFRDRTVLLADHVGGRIRRELRERGFRVEVLPDRRWVELSPCVRVLCIADYIQDSVLLVDVNGRLFVDLNDSRARGAARFVARIARGYRRSYAMRLAGRGDADMINFFDEEGNRLPYRGNPVPVGRQLSDIARHYGTTHVIPFSSFHRYQRADSVWANRHVTPVSACTQGFDERVAGYVEPFGFVDCESDRVTPIRPKPLAGAVRPPEEFGDVWSDELDKEDEARVIEYFRRKQRLRNAFGFLRLKVGGKRLEVGLDGPACRGITFEAPRGSLMQAIEHHIFDDLLIGNFMRTTLHGVRSLYDPDFTFTVAKFADNAGAETEQEVRRYLREYRRRSGGELGLELLADEASRLLRRVIDDGSPFYQLAKRFYYRLR